jgi:uncharacterized protein (TIGR03435 family)
MLQTLLADRFQLTVHRETRELPVYVLSVAKRGFKPSKEDCVASGRRGNIYYGRKGQLRTLDGGQIAMKQFIQYGLGNSVDRIIPDNTGLGEIYTFHLEWVPESLTTGGQNDPVIEADGPSLFTALEEQLGLRLEARRGR